MFLLLGFGGILAGMAGGLLGIGGGIFDHAYPSIYCGP